MRYVFARVFLLLCAASAFAGWCAGYNFDHRDSAVGIWAALTFFIATWFAALITHLTE